MGSGLTRRLSARVTLLALLLAIGLVWGGFGLSRLGGEPGDNDAATPAPPIGEAADLADEAQVAAAAEPAGGPSDIEAAPSEPAPAPLYSFVPALPAEPGKRTVAIDPGHGGWEIGAVSRGGSGQPDLAEKNANLRIGLKLRDMLEEANYRVIMTRDSDSPLAPANEELGRRRVRVELQARVNLVNEARADLFVSIHNNGSPDPGQSGAEVWYSKDRPFADQNWALAGLLQENIVKQLRALGHDVRDRGIKDDSGFRVWQGRRFNLFVLGPPRNEPSSKTATLMPGALGESLFLTNAVEAGLLRQERTHEAIARGYFDGIQGYFALIDGGELTPPPPHEEVAAERPISPPYVTGR